MGSTSSSRSSASSTNFLAAVAPAVVTTILARSGLLKWAWLTGIPLFGDAAVTLTASWQKVFSGRWRAVRSREPLPTSEAECVESNLVAPAGMFPTREERREPVDTGAGTAEQP